MLLPTKDGIWCDICGSIHKKKFIYYSMDLNTIKVNTPIHQTTSVTDAVSLDVCNICFDKMKSDCTKHLGATKNNAIKCDLCPTYMSGVFNYSKALLAKVEVDSEQKEEGPLSVEHKHMDFNICGKCKSQLDTRINKTKGSMKEKGDWS